MPRVNVYLPADLASAVSDAELNLSALLQQALREELSKRRMRDWLDSRHALPSVEVPDDVLSEALQGAKDDFGRLRP
jgi:post-segregation antitoxin (ccd killing protein)